MLKPGPTRPSRLPGPPFRKPITPPDPRHFPAGKATLGLRGSLADALCSWRSPSTYLPETLTRIGSPFLPRRRHPALTFLRCLCKESCRLERQPEPRMVRTDAGHWTDTSRCSPSKMRRTLSAPITRTVGRPNRCVL